jgi:hypothetical protein
MRIQSDHSESDRSYSQETLASVPITEKDPLERVFFFGRFISLLSIFRLSTTILVYLTSLENQNFFLFLISLVFLIYYLGSLFFQEEQGGLPSNLFIL